MSRGLCGVIAILLLFSAACSLPSMTKPMSEEEAVQATVSYMMTNAATAGLPAISTPTKLSPYSVPTNTSQSQTTAVPLATTIPPSTATVTVTQNTTPCNLASFVMDVNYPDGTEVIGGTAFTKTWRLMNAGTCTWTSAYSLVFYDGAQMNGPLTQPLPGTVSPGQTADISVKLTAPASPNTYTGYWKLRDPNGEVFGLASGAFWVEIKSMLVTVKPPIVGNWPTVKQGDSGPLIAALQLLLRFNGQTLSVDGQYGLQTRLAVGGFQTQTGLTSDGVVGPKTWAKLVSGAQLAQGINNESTRALQVLLREKYDYDIDADGVFGPATKNAVIDFQKSVNMTPDGVVTPLVWQALISN